MNHLRRNFVKAASLISTILTFALMWLHLVAYLSVWKTCIHANSALATQSLQTCDCLQLQINVNWSQGDSSDAYIKRFVAVSPHPLTQLAANVNGSSVVRMMQLQLPNKPCMQQYAT
eukprot:1246722-Pleurochrysis_carterae.AAC.1